MKQTRKPRILSWSIGVLLTLSAGFAAASGDIAFATDQAYPEGVAYAPRQGGFLVSSIHHGIVGKVTMQGKYAPFIKDDKLISSIGMHLDVKRNALWVAVSDLGASSRSTAATTNKLAAVAVFNATTGKRIAYHDLGGLVDGAHFANDLTMDAKGNVYVTDSFSPVIYRVDTAGRASVFATSDMFKGEGFNLNGIVYNPGGYLLVAKYNSGDLFKVDLNDPTRIERVQLPEAVKGADGLVMRTPGHLTVVQNMGIDEVTELVSIDDWKSAYIIGRQKSAMSFPTTAAKVGGAIYVLNARLDTLMNKDVPKVGDYLLQKLY